MSNKDLACPKKFFFVSPNLSAGGAQRQLINIANGFHQKGYDVSVFLFYNEGELLDSLHENIKIFSPLRIPLIRKLKVLWIAYGIICLFKTILVRKPEILYSRHWPKMPIAIIGQILKVKTVSGEGNNLEHTLLLKKKSLLFHLRRICARLSDEVVANSQSLGREVKQVFNLKSEVKTVYNGVDIETIRKKSQEEQPHKWLDSEIPVIIAVGSLKVQKGFHHLLNALEIVNRTKTVRLIVIGGGEKKELLNLSEKLSLNDKIDFIGAVSNPFPYISKADIFVCSSLYEGLSNVILEALVLGKPIISTDHKHGANEIIENQKNGILVPVEDPENMAKGILEILNDDELRKRLTEEAIRRSETFSRDKMILAYEELFKRICRDG